MTDFKKINYLQSGTLRQRNAYSVLHKLGIFDYLKDYNPILAGTIPIDIDLPDSDLDIICECHNHSAFKNYLKNSFGKQSDFKTWSNSHYGTKSTIASFTFEGQEIEIFGQSLPTDKQNAYRHMLIEKQLLLEKGNDFKQQILELKKKGMKTEPAFAKLLGLEGDPYLELLKLEKNLKIREITPKEYPFLKDMLYQAIFVADEKTVLPKEIIEQPDLQKYIQDFGQKNDYCLVASQHKILVGAIWIRSMDGYGFVDIETPELSMAVLKEYRGQGIGKQLLTSMIDRLKNKQIKRVSLSVDKANFAHMLYKKLGFIDYSETKKSVVMIKELNAEQ